MLHEPAKQEVADGSTEYKTKLGFIMFVFYGLVYAGFVMINVVDPLLMEKIIFWNLNLAVVYGFGLIVFAILLALIYNHLCSAKEASIQEGN